MRFDSVGLFWEDKVKEKKRGETIRIQPPIPNTGWQRPREYPNLFNVDVISLDLEIWDPEFDDFGPGWARGKGHIVGISIGTKDGKRWYFPIRHTIEPEWNLDVAHTLSWLRDVLASKNLRAIVGANLIYDLGWLAQEGVYDYWDRTRKIELVDVQFAEALLDETSLVRLDILAFKYLGERKTTEVVYKWCADFYGGKPDGSQRANLWRAPPRLVGPYAEGDADLPLRIAPYLYARLAAEGLVDIFRMECRLIPLLIAMRIAGVSVDLKKAEEVRGKLIVRAITEQAKINSIAGTEVNINSSDQLSKLFDKLGIAYPRTDPSKGHLNGQPSFTKAYLEKLQHPIGQNIREVRRLEKLGNVFIGSYILDANVKGKIHGSYHPLRSEEYGTKVGRFSASHPNLTNVPIRDEELGHLIRSMFIPDEGHRRWRKFDFSQIQYRSLVHWAEGPGSDEARKRYNDYPDTDYHKWVQELVEKVFGIKLPRRPIKNINFGLSFGMGIDKLLADLMHYALTEIHTAKDANMVAALESLATETGAKQFLDVYHKGVPFAKPTIQGFSKRAGETGFLRSILGRKSRFDLWEPAKWSQEHFPALPYQTALQVYGRIRRAMTHKALNRQLQMDEADIMKMSLLTAWDTGVYDVVGPPRLIVHDEFDHSEFDGPNVEEGFAEFKRIAETVVKLRVPILVEEEKAANWGETK